MNTRRKIRFSVLAGALCAASYSGVGEAGGADQGKKQTEAKARPLSDSEIIAVAETANTGEVAQGKLAEQKANKPAAKSFANMMVTEHGDANEKVEALAKDLGISAKESAVSDEVKNSGDAVQRKLNQSAPVVFDRVYLETQIAEHQKVLKTFDERLIPSAKSPKLKSLLSDLRAHVVHHLQVARTSLENLEKTG